MTPSRISKPSHVKLCGGEGRGEEGEEGEGETGKERYCVWKWKTITDRMTPCVRQLRVAVGGELEVSLT